ncbi:MAG: hypothetical protein LBR37_00050, partial [Erysipelotrichaceae bacterium]|nr:hypothetical protein [Erysipelotrichaceae bacterium]
LDAAHNALILPISEDAAKQVTTNFDVSAEGLDGVAIAWSSSAPAVASFSDPFEKDVGQDTGVKVKVQTVQITRPNAGEEIADVKLTANLSIASGNDATKTLSKTKEFDIKVLPISEEGVIVVDNWAEWLVSEEVQGMFGEHVTGATLTVDGNPAVIKVTNVTIFAKTLDDGAIGVQNGAIVYIFPKEAMGSLTVGKVYNLQGTLQYYYGMPELCDLATEIGLVQEVANATPETLSPAAYESVSAYCASLGTELTDTTFGSSNPFPIKYINVEAKVRVQGAGGNYDVLLVDKDYEGPDIKTDGSATAYATNAIMVYYKSNIGIIKQFDGVVANYKIVVHTLRTNNDVAACLYFGDGTELTLTDAQAVVADAGSISIDTFYPTSTTAVLPLTGSFGSTISWASNNEAIVIDGANATITAPASSSVEVTLTATVTKGVESTTRDIVVIVGERQVTNIADLSVTGEVYKVKGVVVASDQYRNVGLVDASGSIIIYLPDAAATISFAEQYLGKEVSLEAAYTPYNALKELTSVTNVTVTNANPTMPPMVNLDGETSWLGSAINVYNGRMVGATGAKVISKPELQYGNIQLNVQKGTETLSLFFDSRATSLVEAAGAVMVAEVNDIITFSDFLLANNSTGSNPRAIFTGTSGIEVTGHDEPDPDPAGTLTSPVWAFGGNANYTDGADAAADLFGNTDVVASAIVRKNGPGTVVAKNNAEIRMYGVAGKNGNAIEFTLATGLTLVSVQISAYRSGGTEGNDYVTIGGVETPITASSTTLMDAVPLTGTTFTIQNTCDDNTQVRITQIIVKYATAA